MNGATKGHISINQIYPLATQTKTPSCAQFRMGTTTTDQGTVGVRTGSTYDDKTLNE